VVGITRNYSEIVGIAWRSRQPRRVWPEGGMAVRDLLPALRAGAGRIAPEAALDSAYVSHAEDSTIGSNFCQPLIRKKLRASGSPEESINGQRSGGRHPPSPGLWRTSRRTRNHKPLISRMARIRTGRTRRFEQEQTEGTEERGGGGNYKC